MNSYKVIGDEEELKKFFTNVLELPLDGESIMVSHSARAKRLTPEQKEEYALGRAEMFHTEISKKRYGEPYTWIDFLSFISKFEVNEMAYLTRNKKPYPASTLVTYIYMNPSSEAAVVQDTLKFINTINSELIASAVKGSMPGIQESLRKMPSAMNHIKACHAQNSSRKVYVDFDADIDGLDNDGIKIIKDVASQFFGDEYHTIRTAGGVHILAKRNAMRFNPNLLVNALTKALSSKYAVKEIKKNDNNMIPIPGTYQYGQVVRIV